MLVNSTTLARELGLNPSSITRAVASKRLRYAKGKGKLFNLEEAKTLFAGNREREASPLRQSAARAAAPAAAPAAAAGSLGTSYADRLLRARVRLEETRALREWDERQLQAGLLYPRDAIARVMADVLSAMKDSFDALPERTAPRVAGLCGTSNPRLIAAAAAVIAEDIQIASRGLRAMISNRPWEVKQ